MSGVTSAYAPPDIMAAIPANVIVRERGILVDLPRARDIAEYCRKERDERIAILAKNVDVIPPDRREATLVRMSAHNIEDQFRMITTISGMAWCVDRCFRRANPKVVRDDYDLSDYLSIEEVRRVFRTIGIASGLLEPLPPGKEGASGKGEDPFPENADATARTE